MRQALLIPLALVACGEPPPRPAPEGQALRTAVDAATKVYSDCVTVGAKTVPLDERQAGPVVDGIMEGCAPPRAALVAAIARLQRLNHPKQTQDYVATVAETSVDAVEPDLRESAIVALVSRQLATEKKL